MRAQRSDRSDATQHAFNRPMFDERLECREASGNDANGAFHVTPDHGVSNTTSHVSSANSCSVKFNYESDSHTSSGRGAVILCQLLVRGANLGTQVLTSDQGRR